MTWLVRALLAVALVTSPARAEPVIGIVPVECVQFWPADSWDELLSLAACSQDTTVGHIHFADQIDGLLEELDASLIPTLQIYLAAVRNGPGPIKLRAAFQMAMSQVSLMTRARLAVAPRDRALRAALETKLEPTAYVAWKLFVAIDEAVTDRPELAFDAVTRDMIRTSRVYADALDASWQFSRERGRILATDR